MDDFETIGYGILKELYPAFNLNTYQLKWYNMFKLDIIQKWYDKKNWEYYELLNKYSDNLWIFLISWTADKLPYWKENVSIIVLYWVYGYTFLSIPEKYIIDNSDINLYNHLSHQLEEHAISINNNIENIKNKYGENVKEITLWLYLQIPNYFEDTTWLFWFINNKKWTNLNNELDKFIITDEHSTFSLFEIETNEVVNQYTLGWAKWKQ